MPRFHEGTYGRVGNAAYVEGESGDKGMEVVTLVKPARELRIFFEPDNGTYLCGEKWSLRPAGTATQVMYEETFTLSGPMDAASLDHCTRVMNTGLNRLKAMCEKK